MSALLLLAMFVSGTVAQTAPTEDVGTNTLAAMTPTSAEWTALSADPTETVVAVTSAGKENRVFVCFPRWFANHSAPTVAEVHVDGAGKTTLMKLLVGELTAKEGVGEHWMHHNLRLSYVAQHSMHRAFRTVSSSFFFSFFLQHNSW